MASSVARQASSAGQASRRANADVLRNYYGIGSGSSSGAGGGGTTAPSDQDPADPNSAAFDVDVAFKASLRDKGLAQLLEQESDLLTDIRELDGERQSLVYNHHHELVQASETMRKMKDRADALMPSLSTLQASLQAVSANADALSPPTLTPATSLDQAAPVINLPQRLRDLIVLAPSPSQGLTEAQGLWGQMEAVLASWDEAGVVGAKDIMHECRMVLREARQEV